MKQPRPQLPQPKRPVPTGPKQARAVARANADKLDAALARHQQGQLDQAEAIYKEILQSQPQHFDALRLLATIAAQRKNSAAAVDLFEQALKINPDHASSLNNRGNALVDLKRLKEALESYDRALKIEPDYAEALYNRGNALVELKRHEDALESYDRALKIKPDYAEVCLNRAFVSRLLTVGCSKISIGRFTYGHENIFLIQWGEGAALVIGSFCSIASSITIFLGGNHRVDWITTFPFGHIFVDQLGGTGIQGHPATNGDVFIGNDVWLGHNSTIMSGISIGDGAVIAANSHVVKDVDAYSIVGGNPAKEIRFRFDPEIRRLLLELRWWDLPLESIKSISSELSKNPDVGSLQRLLEQFRNHPRYGETS